MIIKTWYNASGNNRSCEGSNPEMCVMRDSSAKKPKTFATSRLLIRISRFLRMSPFHTVGTASRQGSRFVRLSLVYDFGKTLR
jgi:hypothetical protein